MGMNYREQLVEFYQKYNPAKLHEVDSFLQTFAGREESMFAALRAKYETNETLEKTTSPLARPAAQLERESLLREMESVDMEQLLTQVKGRQAVEGDLLVHTMTFFRHFASCARRFTQLSSSPATSVAATQTIPVAPNHQDATTQTTHILPNHQDACTQSEVVEEKIPKREEDPTVPTPETVDDLLLESPKPLPNSIAPHSTPPLRASMASHSFSNAPPPPPLPPPPPATTNASHAHAMTGAAHAPRASPPGRVHSVEPSAHRRTAIIGPLLASGAVRAGDSLVLQPGVYHENMQLHKSGAWELVAGFPGAPVIIKPLHPLEPILRVDGDGVRVRVGGVVFIYESTSAEETAPPQPLTAVSGGAMGSFDGCHFYNGSCGVEGRDGGTQVRLHLCVLSSAAFAGVFLHHGAELSATQCKLARCDAGVRAAGKASFRLRESVVEEHTTDGVVGYEGAVGALERCSVLRNGGNGVFLSSGAALTVVESTIELNGLYGVQRFQGSTLHLKDSLVRDNALLPMNDTDGFMEDS